MNANRSVFQLKLSKGNNSKTEEKTRVKKLFKQSVNINTNVLNNFGVFIQLVAYQMSHIVNCVFWSVITVTLICTKIVCAWLLEKRNRQQIFINWNLGGVWVLMRQMCWNLEYKTHCVIVHWNRKKKSEWEEDKRLEFDTAHNW